MSRGAQKRDPKFVSQVLQMAETGMSGEQIVEAIQLEQERAKNPDFGSLVEDAEIPAGIKVIAQALAFRDPSISDAEEIHKVLAAAYSCEIKGPESFRSGVTSVDRETVTSLLSDKSYKWCVVEVPNGKEFIADGAIIGACCYSVDGVSRRNGTVEGKLGAIRYCGVLPQFHGLLVGFRLLFRVEETMLNSYKCCRSMVCIPSSRASLMKWIDRRGYDKVGEIPYPSSLGHVLKSNSNSIKLQMYTKPLLLMEEPSADADTKAKKVNKLYDLLSTNSSRNNNDNDNNNDNNNSNDNDNDDDDDADDADDDADDKDGNNSKSSSSGGGKIVIPSSVFEDLPKVDRKLNMHLSPIWRQQTYQTTSIESDLNLPSNNSNSLSTVISGAITESATDTISTTTSATITTVAGHTSFISSASFVGIRDGYYFGQGSQGLGYYIDNARESSNSYPVSGLSTNAEGK